MQELPNIPERIVIARKARGLTQKELADKLGVSQSDISKFETGQIKEPSFWFVSQLTKVLKISFEALRHPKADLLSKELSGLPQEDINKDQDNQKRIEAWVQIRSQLQEGIVEYLRTGNAKELSALCAPKVVSKILDHLDIVRALGLKYEKAYGCPPVHVLYPLPGETGQDFIIQEEAPDNLSRLMTADGQMPMSATVRVGGTSIYQIEHYESRIPDGYDIVDEEAAQEQLRYRGPVLSLPFEELNQCLPSGGMRTGQLAMLLGKSGSGKTPLALELVRKFTKDQRNVVLASLEQPRSQIFTRMVTQELDLSIEEAQDLIKANDTRIKALDETMRRLVIIDNMPDDIQMVEPMTVPRLENMIKELPNPTQVVVVDHLGILALDDKAPSSLYKDHFQAYGYLMRELFYMAKRLDVLVIVLNQLPKEVKEGVDFAFDAGRGTNKQSDYCDYIYTIWMPEREYGISDDERMARAGQIKMKLSKNRHGPSDVAHLVIDRRSYRVFPEIQIGN